MKAKVAENYLLNNAVVSSGVARAFSGGRLAHLEGQNEEENKWSLRKNKKNWLKFEEKMRKVELLSTRDCEAGYGPGCLLIFRRAFFFFFLM